MQSSSKKTVMAFGTFDYFHAGHENYLKQAKALGDYLVVVVARDETVKMVKTRSPLNAEKKRFKDVSSCIHVDKAVMGNLDDKYKVIKKYRPDIIALGYDQFVFTYNLEKFLIQEKLNAEIIRLQPFKPDVFKSSLLRSLEATCSQDSLTTLSV